jgi:hypothetical protein
METIMISNMALLFSVQLPRHFVLTKDESVRLEDLEEVCLETGFRDRCTVFNATMGTIDAMQRLEYTQGKY